MKFQSFLKIYFIYISSLDYYIYKKVKLFNFKSIVFLNQFCNISFLLLINNKKLENDLIYELKLILILEQLTQFYFINNKCISGRCIFIFLDNLFVFYYKMYFCKLISLLLFRTCNFSKFFLQEYSFLLEMFLFNFKISFQSFNTLNFLLKLN